MVENYYMEKYFTRLPFKRVSCDVEKDSSESRGELDVELEHYKPPEKKVALASSSTK